MLHRRSPRPPPPALALALACALLALGQMALPPAAAAPSKKAAPKQPEEPPTMNPYANRPYAGCDGGYCPPADAEAEAALFAAAASGDAPEVARLLASPSVNATRNIVPDKDGFVRVVDVAVWAAAKHGRLDALKALLDSGYEGDLEEGHIVDLAAANGDTAMLELLISKGFHIGSNALAYAAKNKNADMMKALLAAARGTAKGRDPDLKAAMQAACAAGDEAVLRILVEQGGFKELVHPVSKRPASHDWRGDYVAEAVATGHPLVLELLFKEGYQITWQNAQELVKLAAAVGKPETLRHLMAQPTVAEDSEELEEAVDNALKVAAEEGKGEIVDFVLSEYPELAKGPCPGALIKATMYGHFDIVRRLQRACNVSSTSARLQAAGWLGALLNAARGGHLRVAQLLLAHKDAPAMLAKLYENLKPRKDGPPQLPDPEKDPLAVAAARGHYALVDLLAPQRALCGPCAAVAAAGAGHDDVFAMLVRGPASGLLEADGDKIQDALRAAAAAMEGGHWGALRVLLAAHESDKLGPYFLPGIAQQGRIKDLENMVALIEELGCSDREFMLAQAASALVSAALSGHTDVLLELGRVRARWAAEAAGGGGAEGGEGGAAAGGGGGDKTEL